MKTLSERLDTYSFITKPKPFQPENNYINEQTEKNDLLDTLRELKKDERKEKRKQRKIDKKIKLFVNSQKVSNNNQTKIDNI